MKEYFMRSSKVVNQHILLIGLVGLFNVSFISGAMAYVYIAGLILNFFLVIVLNGKITQTIKRKEQNSALRIVNDNWKNYLIALLVIGLPIFAFNSLIKLLHLPAEQHILFKEVVKASVWAVSIYVMPIVFLKKMGFLSVVVGISYFFSNFKKSILIIPFVAAMFFINAGGYLWAIAQFQAGSEVLNVMLAMVGLNIVSTYLSFIVFATASFVLVETRLNSSSGVANA